jgi:hypothetical protein
MRVMTPSPLRGEGWGEGPILRKGRIVAKSHGNNHLRRYVVRGKPVPHPNPLPEGERELAIRRAEF